MYCADALHEVISELRRAQFPFEVTIAPVTERASGPQIGLWKRWMKDLASGTSYGAREVELRLLAAYAPPRHYQFGDAIKCRPSEFEELTREQASELMTHAEVLAAEAGIRLTPGRG